MVQVAVVGGGYGGIAVAKAMDANADVVLIDQKEDFVHHAAALRAATDEAWARTIFMPYTRLLSRGKVLRGTVSRVDGHTISIYGHDPIEADYIVLATGSAYPFPGKFTSPTTAVAQARLDQLRADLGEAERVLLVGGGSVGIEFAGELRAAFPELAITIVEKGEHVLATPGYTDGLREEVERQLDQLGVEVVAGSELAYLPTPAVGELGRFTVQTKDGVEVSADMWFRCYGTSPNTGYLEGGSLADVVNPDGTVRVEPTMQVAGHGHVYAIGDITDVRESKRADAARQQAGVVVSNLTAALGGQEPQTTYRSTREWVILPLGPELGASQLIDMDGNTRILGPEQTAEIKGADLMASVVRSQLNLP